MRPPFVIAAFYHFVPLPNYSARQQPLLERCRVLGIKGTILLAAEGINSTIAGSREGVDAFLAELRSQPEFSGLEWKESFADFQPFERLKVRLKKEIVRLGVENLDIERRGRYVAPAEWDTLIQRPDVLVVDTRNDYEVKIGRFKGALDPKTETFRDFPAWASAHLSPARTPKVAMYCTGGIRCEKSTALLRSMGFEEVYHLQGGILKYLEETQNKNGLWEGDCFVFDDRVAVDAQLNPSGNLRCEECGDPISTDALRLCADSEVLCEICFNKEQTLP
jgi:UPF0176 protein